MLIFSCTVAIGNDAMPLWLKEYCPTGADSIVAFKWINKQKLAMQALISNKKKEVDFITHTLQQYDLPASLINLAIIESDLDNNCLSDAGALGIWQLMPDNGVEYGLKVNGNNDERKDLYKSTHAAGKYLQRLYKKYKTLSLTVAAYNCGERPVDRALAIMKTKNFVALQDFLPEETRNHVKKFFYTQYILDNYSEQPLQNSMPVEMKAADTLKTCEVTGAFRLRIIARYLNMRESDLRMMNKEMENDLKLNGTATLHLPIDKMPEFLLRKNEILIETINAEDE